MYKSKQYCYFNDVVNTGIILCEKTDIWKKDKQIDTDVLCILFPDGNVQPWNLLKRKEFEVVVKKNNAAHSPPYTNKPTDKVVLSGHITAIPRTTGRQKL